MRLKYLIAAFAALAIISCGKDSGEEKQGGNTSPVDENGISSLLIREKGQTEWVSSLDISLVTGTTTSLEWQILPESVKDLPPRLASDDVLVARVTQQGSLMARKKVGESTTIRVFVGEKEYATATVHVLPDETSEDPSEDSSEDPSEGPVEQVTLDESHWFYYCYACDELEPIAEKSKHYAAGVFPTIYPYGANIVLIPDLEDMDSYLELDNDCYQVVQTSQSFFNIDYGEGEGPFIEMDPDTWTIGSPDTFGSGPVELSYEDERYVSSCNATAWYSGVHGISNYQKLHVYVPATNARFYVTSSAPITNPTLTPEFQVHLVWVLDEENDKISFIRGKGNKDYQWFTWTSSDPSIAEITYQGVDDDGMIGAYVKLKDKAGEFSIKVFSSVSVGGAPHTLEAKFKNVL